MEKQDDTLCPVCSLYLREGITLKSHLQTHSKEKVIEALLSKQTSSAFLNNDDSGLSISNESGEDDNTISNSESRFFNSMGRVSISTVPPSSFVQLPNNPITQTTPSLTYDSNNIQYSPIVNNSFPQNNAGNSCNAVLTYQTYMTNEGNIILMPVYNMCPPSVMVSNNIVPTPVVNSCVVMPTPNSIEPVSNNEEELSSAEKYTDLPSVEDECVDAEQNEESNERDEITHCGTDEPSNLDENEKATDEEVANIFEVSKTNNCYNDENDTEKDVNADRMSCHSETTVDSKLSCNSVDEESNLNPYLENDDSSPFSPQEQRIENKQTSVVIPNVSVIRVRNDLNYKSAIKDDVNSVHSMSVMRNESFSPIPSTSNCSNGDVSFLELHEQQQKCEVLDLSDGRGNCFSSSEQVDKDYNDEKYLRSANEQMMMEKKKECYILPNSEIPSNSPVPVGNDFNFIGISKSLLTSASLISSVNKAMFADVDSFNGEKNGSNFFEKCEMVQRESRLQGDDKQISTRTLTNYIMKMTDMDERSTEDYRMNIGENYGSASSSRISPFDIQTDESMPARGELSGQESLSSTENSVWELQVQQNTCVQRYSISCKGENSGIKIGLHSLMTEMNFKRDLDNIRPEEFDTNRAADDLVVKSFTAKRVREFHCFYCKKTFDAWRTRQDHIVDEHAEEDGLTVESLFGKKVKLKLENENDAHKIEAGTKIEEGTVPELTETEDNIVCRMCAVTFKTTFDLLKHLKTAHGIRKRSLVCPTCFVRFTTTEEYREHIQKIHPYECMTCGKQFHTRPGYMLHQKRHMKIKPYSCDVCSKSFVTKQKLSEHVNIHTGNNPIKCDLCDSNFKRYSNYQQHKKYLHMNCKRKLKDFVCNCGEVFHSKVKLLWHQEIHDEKPKQCPFCVERFVHAASLTRHVRKWHNEMYLSEWVQKKKNVTCPVCNVSYLHTSLQTHMKIHEGVKPFSCGECSKTFRTKWNLQLHRWTHMSRSAKPYKCKICVKAYIHKTDYDAHVRSHNNCRPYACNVCGRQFIRKYNCLRHMREHIEPRSYKCETCGKEFARSYYLTEHEKVHTGEKPHICHFCGKASATKSNHNKHVKMHTVARENINSEA